MSDTTKIEWTDHTWSPWFGCTKVSAGCTNCYAEADNARYKRNGGGWGKGAPRLLSKGWDKPRQWNRAAEKAGRRVRVFPSLCDPFDAEVSHEWRLALWRLVESTQAIDWLVLTKRPELIRPFQQWMAGADHISIADFSRNWWLGTSVEDSRVIDRIAALRAVPNVTVRFISFEPLIGPVGAVDLTGIHWAIIGGESGPHARPCNVEWIRDLIAQCRAQNVAVFVKQLGAKPYVPLPERDMGDIESHPMMTWPADAAWADDRKGGDWAEWPDDLRVREMPRA